MESVEPSNLRNKPAIAVLKKFLMVFLSAVLVVGLYPAPAQAASVFKPTKSSVLKVMKRYDKDGYYLLKTMSKRGDNIMSWWDGSSFFANFDTMVHEECHGYIGDIWGSENIYIGKKRSIRVPVTKVFRSKKIAKSVPKRLRSDRYRTYVSKAEANLGANMLGAYGMLDEFTAYCWGFNASVRLYSFAKRFERTDDTWLDYLSGSASVAKAYVEFRYFIEHYLYYAKKHNRAVYKGVMKNKKFVRAFKKVDRKFSALVKIYDKRLPKIAGLLRNAGYEVELDGGYFMVSKNGRGSGCGLQVGEYNRFVSELNKSKYRKIERKLGLKRVTKRNPSAGFASDALKATVSGGLTTASLASSC